MILKPLLVNTQMIPLQEAQAISLNYISENITIHYTNDVQIVLKEYMNRNNPLWYARVRAEKERIAIQSGKRPILGFLISYVELFIPKNYRGSLTVQCSSGNVKSCDPLILSKIKCKTISGFVRMPGGSADHIDIQTTSGSIDITDFNGNMELKTISGAICTNIIQGSGAFHTKSGNINLTFKHLTGPVRAKTISGKISLSLPESASFELDSSSISGKISTGFSGSFLKQNHSLQGKTGHKPYIPIHLSTCSGRIQINPN